MGLLSAMKCLIFTEMTLWDEETLKYLIIVSMKKMSRNDEKGMMGIYLFEIKSMQLINDKLGKNLE